MMEKESALLVGGPHDGRQIDTYPGQSIVKMPRVREFDTLCAAVAGAAPRSEIVQDEAYKLHRVHDSRGFHRLIGLLVSDTRGPMQALYEGYGKAGVR